MSDNHDRARCFGTADEYVAALEAKNASLVVKNTELIELLRECRGVIVDLCGPNSDPDWQVSVVRQVNAALESEEEE